MTDKKFSDLTTVTNIPGTALFPVLSGGVNQAVAWSDIAKTWEQGSNITSAATLAIPSTGGYFAVTGTTTVTAFSQSSQLRAGRVIQLKFNAVLILTHNATSLILPGGANITTVAGDVATFRCEDASNNYWRCVQYQRASGGSLQGVTRQVITSSGTYTKPAGCIRALWQIQAPGGGGSGAQATSSQVVVGKGGAAGEYHELLVNMSNVFTVSITMGAAGSGGVAANGSGGSGGDIAIGTGLTGSTLTIKGGDAAGTPQASGTSALIDGLGDAARFSLSGSTADIKFRGGSSGPAIRLSGTVGYAGRGGDSYFGRGGVTLSQAENGNGVGQDGNGYGSGGSGGLSNSATGKAGGAGAPGIIIVTEFY